MLPVGVTLQAAAGGTIYAGINAHGALGAAIRAMSANSFSEYLGTNINEMTDLDPSSFYWDTTPPINNRIGIWESSQAHELQTWNGKMGFDPVTDVAFVVGTTNGAVGHPEASKAVYFDLKTNAFIADRNPTGKSEGHIYDGNVSRPSAGRLIFRRAYTDPQVMARNMDDPTRTWSLFGTITGFTTPAGSIEVFPEMGSAGALVAVDDAGKVWTMDLATKEVTQRSTGLAGLASYPISAYLSGPKKVLLGGGTNSTALYVMDSSGAITSFAHTPPAGMRTEASASGGGCVPLPDGSGLLVMSLPLLQLWKLDYATGTWSQQAALPSPVNTGSVLQRTIMCSMHGLGAVAFFVYIGLDGSDTPTTHCRFFLWKQQ